MKRKELPLPATRKEQLKYILLYRKFDIFVMSILLTVFSLPIFLWLIFANYASIFKETNIFNILFVYGVIAILFPILGLCVGGVCYSIRRLILSEGFNIRYDFLTGIRKTWKPFTLVFFIFGLINLLIHLDMFCISAFDFNQFLGMFLLAIVYLISFLVVIVLSYYLAQTLLYDATFKQMLFTSFRFMSGKILVNLGLFIIILLPYFLIDFIDIMSFIVVGFLLIGYAGLALVLFNFYAFYLFDEYINKDLYGEYYHLGLKKDESN